MLRAGGVYVLISVNGPQHPWFQDYVLPNLVQASPGCRWRVMVHSFTDAEEEDEDGEDGDGDGAGQNAESADGLADY